MLFVIFVAKNNIFKVLQVTSFESNLSTRGFPLYAVNIFLTEENYPRHAAYLPYFSVLAVSLHCNDKCCYAEAFPLRMLVSPTGQKNQDMAITPGELFKNAVVQFLIVTKRNKTRNLEMVSMICPKYLIGFCIGNTVSQIMTE